LRVTDILDDLHWRGLIALTTDEQALRTALAAGPLTLYGGFDPTAPSLHIGNLVLILTLRRFQLAGHRPLGLVGGATGLIGDPSGKSAERVLNDPDVVAAWVDRTRAQIEPFLDFAGPNAARMVNNLDWTAQLSAIDFLRDIGKHFPVNRMVGRESVAARLDAGISYTEFSYQILQAMDFLELHRRFGCRLQAGGSDQWGNLTAGVDLIRRVTGERVHALATPLITKADGTKYGKTEGDAVWLDPEMTSPYAFYQFWFNQADADVIRLVKVYSFRSQEEIEELEKQTAERPAARIAQRALASELTAHLHGDGELARVEAASRALFGQGDLRDLDDRTLAAALAEVPSAEVPLVNGVLPPISDLLALTGLVASKSAGRRTVAEGGAYINNRKVTDPEETIGEPDLLFGQWAVLRRGKRNIGAVRVVR
jgi:tyrosyl-tRNA synthetase